MIDVVGVGGVVVVAPTRQHLQGGRWRRRGRGGRRGRLGRRAGGDDQGKRLAKRDDARALAKYRAEGATPADIRAMIGL